MNSISLSVLSACLVFLALAPLRGGSPMSSAFLLAAALFFSLRAIKEN